MRWLAIIVLEVLALGLLWRGTAVEDEGFVALGTVLFACLNALLLLWWVACLARKWGDYPRKNRKRHPPNGELELSRRNFNYYAAQPTDGGPLSVILRFVFKLSR